MIRALPLLLFFFALTTGCGWLNSPVPSRRFDLQWDLQDPTHSQRYAQIFLTDDGLWGYQPESSKQFSPEYTAGDILWLKSKKNHHFFAVVEATPWNYRLQRLDDHPLEPSLTGDLHLLTEGHLSELEGICLVPPNSTPQEACPIDYRHRRWHLFELSSPHHSPDQGPLRLQKSDPKHPLPYPRRGLAGADFLDSWVETSRQADPAAPQIAILATPRVQSTLQATLIIDDACDDLPQSSQLIEHLSTSLQHRLPSLHPLQIETLANRYSADAILDCSTDKPRLLIPTLSRPMLKDDAGRFTGPPALGLIPRQLPALSPMTQSAWTNAAALIAVGDTTAAAFWIEEAFRDLPKHKDLQELATSALPILASAGLPEMAMRFGNSLTKNAWNPENIPDFLETKILLLGQFKMLKEQQEHLNRPQELARARHDTHRAAWYNWSALRLDLAHGRAAYGPAFAPLIEEFEEDDQENWALALWLTLAMKGMELPVVDDPAQLQHRFDAAQAGELWRSVTAQSLVAPCEQDNKRSCHLGSYGWRAPLNDPVKQPTRGPAAPNSTEELLRRLHRIGPTENQQGFSLAELSLPLRQLQQPSERTAFWLATSALIPREQLPELAQRLITELQEQMRRQPASICDELPGWRARFENAAARSRAPVLAADRRQWIDLLDWWSHQGIQSLCGTTDELLAAMESPSIANNRWIKTLFPLLQDRLLIETGPRQRLHDLQRAAALARAVGDHQACTLWNLGISVGAARQGLLDDADRHLVRATNCLHKKDEELRHIRNLVATYIDFERGAGQTVVRDGQIDSALAQLTRRRIDDPEICVGLLPLGFHFEDHLPQTITQIANTIQLAPAPPESFRLQTASQLIEEAKAAYLVGLRDLQRGQWKSAPRSLAQAQAAFQRLKHLPGVANIAFLNTLLFDGRLQALAQDQVALDDRELPHDHALRRLLEGESHLIIQDLDGILQGHASDSQEISLFVAAMIINGRTQELTPFIERLPHTLCSPPALEQEFPMATSDADHE